MGRWLSLGLIGLCACSSPAQTPVTPPELADTTSMEKSSALGATAVPPELVATFQVANPAAVAASLTRYLDAIGPGMSDFIAVGLASLTSAGVDSEKPFSIIVLDVGKGGWLVIAKDADVSKVRELATAEQLEVREQNGQVVVGDPVSMRAGGDFAQVWTGEATELSTVRINVERAIAMADRLMPNWRQSFGESEEPMSSLLDGMADQLISIEAAAEFSAQEASLLLTFHGRPRSSFTKFVSAQKPSTLNGLEKLPTALNGGWFVGAFDGRGLVSVLEKTYEYIGTVIGETKLPPRHTMETLLEHYRGDFAMRMKTSPTRSESAIVAKVENVAEVLRLSREMFVSNPVAGLTSRPLAQTIHRSIEIDNWTVDIDRNKIAPALKAFEPGTQHVTAVGADVVMTNGPTAKKNVTEVVDGLLDKKRFALSSETQAALAAGRANKESILMSMDYGPLLATVLGTGASPPRAAIFMGLRFAPRHLRFRLTVPSETVAIILNGFGAIPGPAPAPTP